MNGQIFMMPLYSWFSIILWLLMVMLALGALPVTKASPTIDAPFPTLTFKAFSDFIAQNFSSKFLCQLSLSFSFH